MKLRKFFLIAGLVLTALLLLAAAAVWVFWLPYKNATSSFPADRQLRLYQQPDGRVQITWPLSQDADEYLLEIIDPQTQQVLYSAQVSDTTEHTVAVLPQDDSRIIRVSTIKEYRFPIEKKTRQRLGMDAIELQDVFTMPEIEDVVWTADPDAAQVTAVLTLGKNCTARLYEVPEEGEPVLVQYALQDQLTLNFGQEGDRPLPAHNNPYTYCFDVYRQEKDYTYYGAMSHSHTVTRQDLLGTNLVLQVQTEADGRHTLSWNETKGEHYVLQQKNGESWEDLIYVAADGDRSYTTACPKPYTNQEYQVIACSEGAEAPIAQSETVAVETASVVTYATIWPTTDLTVYTDTQKSDSIGTASKGKAFCVLGLENDMFRVRFGDKYGYINSNYCMINLPDFIGDLCAYNITNSYDSIYKVHKYDIPKVTGKVITGYEKIRTSADNYIVPLLYPTAKKLEKAALSAREEGYTFLIYDSFRPQSATRFLYDTTLEMTKKTIPEADIPADWESTKEDGEPNPYTYALYMTNQGQYALGNFLAKGTSRHNLGVALDMTLVKNGNELEMQTAIHDLSWYSASGRNNENARNLARFMKNAGFGGLVSEWWHFQDNDTINQYNPPALWSGVTGECWVYDGIGWRYRCSDGSFYTDRTVTIAGEEYTFDDSGYQILETGA